MTTPPPMKITFGRNGREQALETRNFLLVLRDAEDAVIVTGEVDGTPLTEWHKAEKLYELALLLTQSRQDEVRLLGEQAVAMVQGWERGVRAAAAGPLTVVPGGKETEDGEP